VPPQHNEVRSYRGDAVARRSYAERAPSRALGCEAAIDRDDDGGECATSGHDRARTASTLLVAREADRDATTDAGRVGTAAAARSEKATGGRRSASSTARSLDGRQPLWSVTVTDSTGVGRRTAAGPSVVDTGITAD
jgi:hypothetical protein